MGSGGGSPTEHHWKSKGGTDPLPSSSGGEGESIILRPSLGDLRFINGKTRLFYPSRGPAGSGCTAGEETSFSGMSRNWQGKGTGDSGSSGRQSSERRVLRGPGGDTASSGP